MTDELTQLALDAPPSAPNRRARRRRLGGLEFLPSGAVRARVRGVTSTGAPFNLTFTATHGAPEIREDEARQALARLRLRGSRLKAGTEHLEEVLTLAEWRPKAGRRGLVRRPSAADDSAWRGPLRPLWNLRLQDLDDARVAGWVLRQKEAGRSAAYIRNAWGQCAALLRAAYVARIIADVPFRNPALPTERETRTRTALPEEMLVRVLRAATELDAAGRTDGTLRLRLDWQLESGTRPVECAWLRLDDFGRAADGAAVVKLRAAKGGNDRLWQPPAELAFRIAEHVSGLVPKARALGVAFPFRTVERARWRSRLEERWHKGTRERSGRFWVLPEELGALRQVAGSSDWVLYELRHTTHTARAAAGYSAHQLKDAGGWATDKMPSLYVTAGRVPVPVELRGVSIVPEAARLPARGAFVGDVVATNAAHVPARVPAPLGHGLELAPSPEPVLSLAVPPDAGTVGPGMAAGTDGRAVGAPDMDEAFARLLARHCNDAPASGRGSPPTRQAKGIKKAIVSGTFPKRSRVLATHSGSGST